MITTYYFAARYSRHPEMREYRDRLEARVPGASVISRWIDMHDGELEQSFTPEALNADPEGCWKYGRNDLDDLGEAHVVVNFTGNGGGGKGGRHVEFGYALSNPVWGWRLVIVGPRENIFHCHPDVEVYPDFDAFLAHELGATR